MKKRILSLFLTASIISSIAIPASALENTSALSTNEMLSQLYEEELCLDENEEVIFTTSLNNGKIGIVSRLDNSDGSSTYTYFENDIPLRVYNVTPGSGYYTVADCNSNSNSNSNSKLENRTLIAKAGRTVFVGEPANANSDSPAYIQSDSNYEYWGTVNYYYALTDKHFSITCLIKEDPDEYAQFSPLAHYVDSASFIASIVALFFAPEKAAMEKVAGEIWKNGLVRGIIVELTGEAVGFIIKETFSMKAYRTDYDIHGFDASGEYSGEFHSSGGYDVYVYADQGLFSGRAYYQKWTKDDWGNPILGIQMAWEVFGMEYNPSSWS